MRDQLPGFDTEDKAERRQRAPFSRHLRCRRIIERRLDFDYGEVIEVTRLGARPPTASDQRMRQWRTGAHRLLSDGCLLTPAVLQLRRVFQIDFRAHIIESRLLHQGLADGAQQIIGALFFSESMR